MSTPPSRKSTVLLLTTCLCLTAAACSLFASSALATTEGGTGEVCATTDAEGLATIGWEELSNVSDAPVEVQDIAFATPSIEVVEWAIFPREWEGGVLRGDRMPAEDGSDQIAAGATDLLVMVLRLDAAAQSPVTAPRVTYRDGEGREGSIDLTWSITLVPHGQECDTP